MNTTEKAALHLREAEIKKTSCSPVRDIIGAHSVEKAYQVQFLNTQFKIENGREIIGKKIGLTSFKVQEQLGVDQPDFGILFDDMQVANNDNIPFSELMQPKAEAEIAFILKKDLPSLNATLEEVEDAIDYAVAAIEIVGSRIADWDIKITDTIADNASASHFVLGDVKKRLSEIDVVNCRMQLFKNDQPASEGTGAACLDSPLFATHWLAQKMASLNLPLKAGDIVLSGALGPMVNVSQGDVIRAEVEGLGKVKISFKNK